MKTRISEEECEDTKDYDMKQVEKEDFFIEALDTIIFLLIHKGG